MIPLTVIERVVSAITEAQDTDSDHTIIEYNGRAMLESDEGPQMYRETQRPFLRDLTPEESRAIMQQLEKFDVPAEMEDAIERPRESIRDQ